MRVPLKQFQIRDKGARMRKRKLDKKNPPSTARKDFVFEELEPRVLLSADLPIDVPDAYVAEDFHDQEILQDFDTQQTESQQQDAVSLELIFVDTDTPEYQTPVVRPAHLPG